MFAFLNLLHFSLLHWRRLIPCIFVATAVSYFLLVPGPLRDYAERFQKPILWAIYWVWLGVLSSIGLGTGLHTFVLYLVCLRIVVFNNICLTTSRVHILLTSHLPRSSATPWIFRSRLTQRSVFVFIFM